MTDRKMEETGINILSNTQENLSYYKDLEDFYKTDDLSDILKIRSFSLYTPRQVVSDFLARYELFKMAMDVQGSILEFGVFNGQGLMSFAHFSSILEPNNLNREIIGFDTFEGFPDIGPEDKGNAPDIVKPGGLKAESKNRIERAIELYDRNRFIGHVRKIRLVEGDVRKSVDAFLKENQHLLVALLYLDLDIFEPTKLVLERILERVPKGGIVAFDELNHRSFPGETAAFLQVLNANNIELRRVPFCSRISYFRM